jgi:hypothetical protein
VESVVVGFALTLESVNARRYVAIRSARRNDGGGHKQAGGGDVLTTSGSVVWRSAQRKRGMPRRRWRGATMRFPCGQNRSRYPVCYGEYPGTMCKTRWAFKLLISLRLQHY